MSWRGQGWLAEVSMPGSFESVKDQTLRDGRAAVMAA